MGDINIVTQPINPNEAAMALGNQSQPEPTSPNPASADTSSTAEQSNAGGQANSTMETLMESMITNMEKMNAEIQTLKGSNAKLALAGTPESSSSTIEDSLASFFGYLE